VLSVNVSVLRSSGRGSIQFDRTVGMARHDGIVININERRQINLVPISGSFEVRPLVWQANR